MNSGSSSASELSVQQVNDMWNDSYSDGQNFWCNLTLNILNWLNSSIGSKIAGWTNPTIARHLDWSDAGIRWFWQKWINNGRYQRENGSGWSRAIAELEGRAIVRVAITSTVIFVVINPPQRSRHFWPTWPSPDRAEFTISLTVMTLISNACTPSSSIRVVTINEKLPHLGEVLSLVVSPVFSCVLMTTVDVFGKVQKVGDFVLTITRHTGPQLGVMVWVAISLIAGLLWYSFLAR